MTNIHKSLKELNDNLTWKQEYFQEEIGEEEMQELYKLAKILQNKYDHSSKQKSSLLAQFQASNYEYVKEIDKERDNSVQVTRTKNGKTILYARFDNDYKINPTDAKNYINQYK